MPAPSIHTHEGKFHLFIQIAMLLAVITGLEIIIVYLPVAKRIVVASLVVLSLVKFLFVIFAFMHLRWDRRFCTILFFIGLLLAALTGWALLALFNAESSVPPETAGLTRSAPAAPSAPGIA